MSNKQADCWLCQHFDGTQLLPTVIMPTRITTKSATLIDHIYYYEGKNNTKNIHAKSGNLLNLTDHLPNYTEQTKKRQ